MGTGSAPDAARTDEPVHISRSGSTRAFALRNEEQDMYMLANWPSPDADILHEILPTEPRPTNLNFDSAANENRTNPLHGSPNKSAKTMPPQLTKARLRKELHLRLQKELRLRLRLYQNTELSADSHCKQQSEPRHHR